jgi:hypothetical protein
VWGGQANIDFKDVAGGYLFLKSLEEFSMTFGLYDWTYVCWDLSMDTYEQQMTADGVFFLVYIVLKMNVSLVDAMLAGCILLPF